MTRWSVALLCVLGASCVKSSAVTCDDGRTCPAGSTCTATGCASPDQLLACNGLDEHAPCSTAAIVEGRCVAGACVELACGDGFLAPSELCDPTAEAGATTTCDARGFHETDVMVPCGADCTWDVRECRRYCGDGQVSDDEACDGAAPAGSCLDYGYDRGVLGCAPGLCRPGFADCGYIGWYATASPATGHRDISAQGDVVYVAGTVLSGGTVRSMVLTYEQGAWRELGTFPAVSTSTPRPLGVAAASATEVYAVGNYSAGATSGFVARWNGTTWEMLLENTAMAAVDVWAAGPGEVFVLFTGEVRHLRNSTWTTTALPNTAFEARIWGSGPSDVYVAGRSYGVQRYDGAAWSTVTTPLAEAFRVHGTSAADVVVVGTKSGTPAELDVVRWNGTSWQDLALPDALAGAAELNAVSMWTGGPGDVFVTWRTGGVTRVQRHDGTQWIPVGDGLQASGTYVLGGASVANLHALASGNAFRYAGSAWHVSQPGTGELVGAWAASIHDLYATASDGTVHHHDGNQWSVVANVTATFVAGSSASTVYAYDPGDQTLSFYDGTSWTSTTLAGSLANERELAVRGPDDVLLVADNKLWHWNGATIVDTGIGTTSFVSCIPGECIAGHGSSVFRATTGDAWTALPAQPLAPIVDAWLAPDGTILASVGTSFLRFTGGAWEQHASPTPAIYITTVVGAAADDAFALQDGPGGGVLLHFDGVSWSPVRHPGTQSTVLHAAAAVLGGLALVGAEGAAPVALHLVRSAAW